VAEILLGQAHAGWIFAMDNPVSQRLKNIAVKAVLS
jgi:hypothetical protein